MEEELKKICALIKEWVQDEQKIENAIQLYLSFLPDFEKLGSVFFENSSNFFWETTQQLIKKIKTKKQLDLIKPIIPKIKELVPLKLITELNHIYATQLAKVDEFSHLKEIFELKKMNYLEHESSNVNVEKYARELEEEFKNYLVHKSISYFQSTVNKCFKKISESFKPDGKFDEKTINEQIDVIFKIARKLKAFKHCFDKTGKETHGPVEWLIELKLMLNKMGYVKYCKESFFSGFSDILNLKVSTIDIPWLLWRKHLLTARKKMQTDLESKQISIEKIQETFTHEIEKLLVDIIKFIEMFLEKEPCNYAVVGTGSFARRDMGPFSDIDAFILVEKTELKKDLYFDVFTDLLDKFSQLIGELNEDGFHIDSVFLSAMKEEKDFIDTPRQILKKFNLKDVALDEKEELLENFQYFSIYRPKLIYENNPLHPLFKELIHHIGNKFRRYGFIGWRYWSLHQKNLESNYKHASLSGDSNVLISNQSALDVKQNFYTPVVFWCSDIALILGSNETNIYSVLRMLGNYPALKQQVEEINKIVDFLNRARCEYQIKKNKKLETFVLNSSFFNETTLFLKLKAIYQLTSFELFKSYTARWGEKMSHQLFRFSFEFGTLEKKELLEKKALKEGEAIQKVHLKLAKSIQAEPHADTKTAIAQTLQFLHTFWGLGEKINLPKENKPSSSNSSLELALPASNPDDQLFQLVEQLINSKDYEERKNIAQRLSANIQLFSEQALLKANSALLSALDKRIRDSDMVRSCPEILQAIAVTGSFQPLETITEISKLIKLIEYQQAHKYLEVFEQYLKTCQSLMRLIESENELLDQVFDLFANYFSSSNENIVSKTINVVGEYKFIHKKTALCQKVFGLFKESKKPLILLSSAEMLSKLSPYYATIDIMQLFLERYTATSVSPILQKKLITLIHQLLKNYKLTDLRNESNFIQP